ncbi:TPA: hypothetical protein IBV73_004424 [Escherichia coli]|nr:hypothetical protein [Escherichia coli]
MMNPVPWLQMTNMISYQGLVRTFPNSYEVISRADLKMNGGSITTNGINSYGAYANGKKAYINLDYVVLETVADGSYAVAIRQGNIDIKKFYYNKWH